MRGGRTDGRTDERSETNIPPPPNNIAVQGVGGYYKLSKIDDMENGIEPLCSYLMNRGTGFHKRPRALPN